MLSWLKCPRRSPPPSHMPALAFSRLPFHPCLAGMDALPYTFLFLEVIQKLQNSSSTPNRTSPLGQGSANVPAVRCCSTNPRAALQLRRHSPQNGHRPIRCGCLPAQLRRAWMSVLHGFRRKQCREHPVLYMSCGGLYIVQYCMYVYSFVNTLPPNLDVLQVGRCAFICEAMTASSSSSCTQSLFTDRTCSDTLRPCVLENRTCWWLTGFLQCN
jgi:hypothetical protein